MKPAKLLLAFTVAELQDLEVATRLRIEAAESNGESVAYLKWRRLNKKISKCIEVAEPMAITIQKNIKEILKGKADARND